MRHHVLKVTLDQEEHFRYYKFRPEDDDEIWVVSSTEPEVGEGDVLWFEVNERFIGAVPILRVQEDPMNGRWEIWFKGTTIRVLGNNGMPPVEEEHLDAFWNHTYCTVSCAESRSLD